MDDEAAATRSRGPIVVAVLVAVVVIGLATAAWVRTGTGAPDTPGPAPTTPSVPPEPSPATAPPSPAATGPPPMVAPPGTEDTPSEASGFDELAQQVAQVRGLPADEPLNAEIVSDEDLAAVLSDLVDEEVDPDEVGSDQRLLAALRLVPEDLDLLGLLHSLYAEEVIGLYVPEDETLYVQAAEASLTPLEETTAAHEIQHALQDRAFDLDALQDLPDVQADRLLAQQALVEGDALLTQQLWSLAYQDEQERAEVLSESLQQVPGDAIEQAPPYLREAFVFPYQHGGAFVQALTEAGGLGAVDAAFRNPPTATEHILHPDTYLAGEEPVEVTIDAEPPGGWREDVSYTFGEFDVQHLLRVVDAPAALEAAEGWAGGMVRSWTRDGEVAVAGRVAFDTAEDAREACSAFAVWYDAAAGGAEGDASEGIQGPDDAYASTCADTEVRFALAPDADTAVALAR